MARLNLSLLGSFQLAAGREPITSFRSDKVRAVLAYLAFEPGQAHSRRVLMGLLWPEIADQHALNNLRVTLHRLRQALDAAVPGSSERLLTITRHALQLNADELAIDVGRFQQLLAASQAHQHAELAACPSCLAQLADAAAIYRGELLSGFGLADAPAFEEWLLLRREMLHHQALTLFSRLAHGHEMRGAYDQGLAYATRLVELDPYREESQRCLMRLLNRTGQPDQALAHYTRWREQLRHEMDVAPSPETVALVEAIRSGQLSEAAARPPPQALALLPSRPEASSLLLDVPLTDRFFGRTTELERLQQWMVEDRCRLVAILGLGGMGKTTLAARIVRAVADQFEVVIWRSLINAPPLEELLPPLLQLLSHEAQALSQSLDEQLRLLLHALERRRIVLVLDNLESILAADTAGAYRAGYEPYGQLIRQVATREHHSLVLLTSRERPQGFARLEGDSILVRSLPLGGLDGAAGQALLAQRGLRLAMAGAAHDAAALIARYSGNPLALKLVAETVEAIFGGNIAEFLTEEALVFEDIRLVLDQQFVRLSPLEQEVLFWLAVEREPTPTGRLRQNLWQLPSQRIFVETLRSLQRRSLIERDASGFSLQNVVIEYLTDRLVKAVSDEIMAGTCRVLHRQALLIAQARAYVRDTQARLILTPIGEQLVRRLGLPALLERLTRMLDDLRGDAGARSSYAGGNILNLLVHLGIDLCGYDFSNVTIRQAYLQGTRLVGVNFSGATFAHTRFTGAFGQIMALAVNPDYTLLASAGSDGQVRLWKLPERQAAANLVDHQGMIESLVFSPDGRLLASAGGDHSIRLWDVDQGRLMNVFQAHLAPITQVAFHSQGDYLASASEDHSIGLWHVPSGRLIATLSGHRDWATAVAFHPSGNLLISGGADCRICLWDIDALIRQPTEAPPVVDLTPLSTWPGPDRRVVCLACSPDGSLLAAGGIERIGLWSIPDGTLRATLDGHTSVIRALSFSPDGSLVASGSADHTARLWAVASGRTVGILRGHTHALRGIAFSPNGDTLISCSLDDTIRFWDLTSTPPGQLMGLIQGYATEITALAFSPDGKALVTGDKQGVVALWLLDQTTETWPAPRILGQHQSYVRSVAFNPQGDRLASGGDDRTILLWHFSESRPSPERLIRHQKAVKWVAFSPDGRRLASTGDDGQIYLWDVSRPGQTAFEQALPHHQARVSGLAFSPIAPILVSVDLEGALRFWDLTSGTCLYDLPEPQPGFGPIAFHPAGHLIATSNADKAISLWSAREADRGRLLKAIWPHRASVSQLAFSPDGNLLASSSTDTLVHLWHLDHDTTNHVLRDAHGLKSLAFHPNGRLLAAGRDDGQITLWDVATGDCLYTLALPGPYQDMNISDVAGLSEAQRASLKALGAVEEDG